MAYSDYVSPEIIEPVIWKTLLAMEAQAAHLVPVKSGQLRDSLSFATSKNRGMHGAGFLGAIQEIEQPSSDYQGALGSTLEYARAVEQGRDDMPNYPAQPYLRPALDWIRMKLGQITGKEFKVQLAYYNIRHPYRGVEIRTE